jgi:phosphonate transport system substrate-binding protein
MAIDRRRLLRGGGSLAASFGVLGARAHAADAPLRFALTPVLLTSDLVMLEALKDYLAHAMGRPGQVDAAWICGYPFVAYRKELALVAVPVWRGKPLYQSYLIGRAGQKADNLADLAGTVHAFSDPDSNSGYLVTCAALAEMGQSPGRFFSHFFYTYGHRNVVRAVATGLAVGGSVDGYVYDVLREAEPALCADTRVILKSELLGFPPIACPAAEAQSPTIMQLREALIAMPNDQRGRDVLAMLRLDGFSNEPPELFDGIARKMDLVRGVPP